MRGDIGPRSLRGIGCALAAVTAIAAAPAVASADGPGVGAPHVVTLGDSAISGEAGRWAGNTNDSYTKVDALGAGAYDDAGSGETIRNCHRSRSAQAFIGGGVTGVNFACSGGKTTTGGTGSGQDFKPGIDFYSDASGRRGQALLLQEFAATHNVTAVVVMIGANDYGFADVVTQCVTNWLTSPSWWKNYCSDDSDIVNRFTAAQQTAKTNDVRAALQRVAQAMTNAGYSSSQYTIIGQTYWNPIPRSDRARYPETGWTRQSVGGCGAWNRDVNWANDVVVPAMNNSMRNGLATSGLPNTVLLDLQWAFDGRRLCENTVGLLEERGIATWRSAGAVDNTEWVNQIRTVTTITGPYQLQESIHANYWGQLAMRNCLRLAYNGGAVRGGVCNHGTGLNAQSEPNMTLR
jgi:lysophospholipase L1-like esterase